MDRVSPVSRFMRRVADRAPSWFAIAGSAVSLYSLMALSSSDFLYLDLTTPAFISHLRENTELGREPVVDCPPALPRTVKGQKPARQRSVAYAEIASSWIAAGVATAKAARPGASSR